MTYLDLAPAITALRARPEEFEFSNDTLYHPRSRHRGGGPKCEANSRLICKGRQ